MEIEEAARKELDRMEGIIGKVETLNGEGEEIFQLAKSYLTDAKYFYEKKKFLEAFEAAVICWAYIDAGLHLKLFRVPEGVKKNFTITK